MIFMKKHFNNIVKANNDNRLAIFVGAGISKCSENDTIKMPTWNNLISEFKKDLGLSSDESDYLKIAQLYFLEFGEFTYYEKLKSFFPINIEPSIVHKLIFDINPQCVITTNWDNILEKTIDNNAYIYDIISSDEDLVKSTLQKKLIKLHGEFSNHNIVFKEDDYLSYSHNFTLIENYMKSILSTHTILFIGYSYNDINLKHIMKWLQNHSEVSPPRYLTTFYQNTTQDKYLKNHGITVLVLDKIDDKYNYMDVYSNKMASFLDFIANNAGVYGEKSEDEIVDYIYSKLEILNNQNGILLDQVLNTLTNCRFIYTPDNLILLDFCSKILTTDLDKNERIIHKTFLELLRRYDKEEYNHTKFNNIFNILIKANINGIVISDIDIDNIEYISIDNIVDNPVSQHAVDTCFNFDFCESPPRDNKIDSVLESAYKYYQLNNYEKAYNISETAITMCLKQRNYTQLFLSMFNRNILLRALKFSFLTDSHDQYLNVKEYDLKDKLNNLPKDLQKALGPIYHFSNFDYLYKYAFSVSKALKYNVEAIRTIEYGGRVFNSNITESSSKHKNLVLSFIKNRIMIDHYVEYITINQCFVEIAIIRQAQNAQSILNKIELYSCIKYFGYDDLTLMFNKFHNNTENRPVLNISDIDKKWLIEKALPNITALHYELSDPVSYLNNVIFLLSMISIDNESINKIMSIFSDIISKGKNTIGIYKAINSFMGTQYRLYKTEISNESIICFIEIILNKFIHNQYNAFEYHAISTNSINNIFAYAKLNKVLLSNTELITRLLTELNYKNISDKIRISQSLLFSLYDISNNHIQQIVKSFITGIDTSKCGKIEETITFKLLLLIRDFDKFDTSIVDMLDKYLTMLGDGKLFSSLLYHLKKQLDYLVNNMSFCQFNDALEKVNQAVNNYENKEKTSIL